MKRYIKKTFCRFPLYIGMAMSLILFSIVPVSAQDDGQGEQPTEVIPEPETGTGPELSAETQESLPAEPEPLQESVPEGAPIVEAIPEEVFVTAPAAAEEVPVLVMAAAGKDNAMENTSENTGENTGETAGENTGAVTITIGGTSFSPDDEAGQWSDGKGWKNVPGQYVAMVDYDGSDAAVSASGDVVTLAVAGVNRIGTLQGDCSYRIVGSGIVLIDKIEITEGHTITLHPNTALYDEGSAAVFLFQKESESYQLINGGITGILDESCTVDNVRLTIPSGSSLMISARASRMETWYPEDGTGPVTDVTEYTSLMPDSVLVSEHMGGSVNIEGYEGRLVIGKNASLTVDSGASVQVKTILDGYQSVKGELVVQGAVEVNGEVTGGRINVSDGGSLGGSGTVSTAEVILEPSGNPEKSLLLDDCSLTVNGTDSMRHVSAKIQDSVIYIKGKAVFFDELIVSGHSVFSAGIFDNDGSTALGKCEIGDIAVESGSDLKIVVNDHQYIFPLRLLEDSFVRISGKITGGGDVSVCGGSVEYTGTQADNLPSVPFGYAARVYVTETAADSTENPLNMSAEEALSRAKNDTIPVVYLEVRDSLVSQNISAREWLVTGIMEYPDQPLQRDSSQEYTCASLLQAYGRDPGQSADPDIPDFAYNILKPAVEVIYSDLSRQRLWLDDPTAFTTDDVIMVRMLNCTGQGGQGGSSSTSVETSFTGSGTLGGPGSGSMQTGEGKVIYGQGNDPDPSTPTPPPTVPPTAAPTATPTAAPTAKPTSVPTAKPDSSGNMNHSGTAAVPGAATAANGTRPRPVNTAPAANGQTGEQPAGVLYTIYFETDGGTKIPAQTVHAGKTAVKPLDPEKEGYIFAGWYIDREYKETFNFFSPINADTTVYAKWTEPEKTGEAAAAEPAKKAGLSWLWILAALILAAAGFGIVRLAVSDDEEE